MYEILKGKVAIITGISKGIGRAVTEQLLQYGAKVIGWGLSAPEYTHENLSFYKCNVRNLKEVEEVANKTFAEQGERVDILVNNSGLGYFGNFDEMSPEQFIEIFEVNVYGIYHTCRMVIPKMKAAQSGHIVNLSSIAGLEGLPQVAAYCGAKHAVRGITQSLFKELREDGIKVTGVYPGSVKTDFFNNAQGIDAHDGMMKPEEVAFQIVNTLASSSNFNVNTIEFRPLNPKKRG
jgi:NAD(P)-dependent dehydrogenase (short-subunit alcohol dehydrogenase family)